MAVRTTPYNEQITGNTKSQTQALQVRMEKESPAVTQSMYIIPCNALDKKKGWDEPYKIATEPRANTPKKLYTNLIKIFWINSYKFCYNHFHSCANGKIKEHHTSQRNTLPNWPHTYHRKVCGLISPLSKHGNKNFIKFVEINTGYCIIHCIYSRDKAAQHITGTLETIYNIHGTYSEQFGSNNPKDTSITTYESTLKTA